MVVVVKVNVIPYKEHINRPYAAAVVLFAAEVLVKPADKRLGVKELFGGFALEFLFDDVVVFFISEPYAGGNREAELLFFGGRFGHVPRRRLAQGVFGVVFVYPEFGGQL